MTTERKNLYLNLLEIIAMFIWFIVCVISGGIYTVKLIKCTYWLWTGLCFTGGMIIGLIVAAIVWICVDAWCFTAYSAPELGSDTDSWTYPTKRKSLPNRSQ